MPPFVAIGLFSGAGGADLGVERAGFRHLLAVEMDKSAVATHRAYFNGKVFEGRCEDALAALRAKYPTWADTGKGDVALLHGGPPCQGFSQAGAGAGEYDPRDGFPHFLAWVRYVKPRAFLIENVKGLTTKKHRPYLDRVLADLRDCGYTVDWRVLNAADFGVAQRRERILIVGFREAEAAAAYRWPEPTHSEEALVRDKWITGDYIHAANCMYVGPIRGHPNGRKFEGQCINAPGLTVGAAHGESSRQYAGETPCDVVVGRDDGTNEPRVVALGPANRSPSRREQAVLKHIAAGGPEVEAALKLKRWRTVRDGIGDIAGMIGAGRMTDGSRRAGPHAAGCVPARAGRVQNFVENHDASTAIRPPSAQATLIVAGKQPLHSPDAPGMTLRDGHGMGPGFIDAVAFVVANHVPAAPPKPSESTPTFLHKHPPATLDDVGPTVRTGHRDAGTAVVALANCEEGSTTPWMARRAAAIVAGDVAGAFDPVVPDADMPSPVVDTQGTGADGARGRSRPMMLSPDLLFDPKDFD